jgi:beta-lactamase regulating signal transducer with metallopeptidase domain
MPALVLLWLAGSLAMSMRLAGGWVWLQWLRRRPDTLPAPDPEQLALLRLCQRMGVASNLRLLVCRSVPGPTVLGWLKPVILIPPALLAGLSPLHLELILAHELAHVLRHDYLVNLLQSIAEVLFFFHPAVWWLSNRIRQEREQASDDLAVHFCGDALDYAQALTTLEALASGNPISPSAPRLALAARGGDFMSRIQRLISPTAPTQLAPRAGLAVLLLLGAGYALQARAQGPSPAAQETLAKGTVLLRRWDVDSPDGQAKKGSIDLRVQSAPMATIERALGSIMQLPENPGTGFAEVRISADPVETGGPYTYKFTGVDPIKVLAIIRAHAASTPISKTPGSLEIQRQNNVTYQGGLLPAGLFLDVWAGDVPADLVMEALNQLEGTQPRAGIPQTVRREVAAGVGKGPRISLDLRHADPLVLRATLEKALAEQPK